MESWEDSFSFLKMFSDSDKSLIVKVVKEDAEGHVGVGEFENV